MAMETSKSFDSNRRSSHDCLDELLCCCFRRRRALLFPDEPDDGEANACSGSSSSPAPPAFPPGFAGTRPTGASLMRVAAPLANTGVSVSVSAAVASASTTAVGTATSRSPFWSITFCSTSWQASLATSGSMTTVSSPTPSVMTSSEGLLLLVRGGPPSLALMLGLAGRAEGPEEGEEGSDSEDDVDRDREDADGLFCSASCWWAGDSSNSVSPMAADTQATRGEECTRQRGTTAEMSPNVKECCISFTEAED